MDVRMRSNASCVIIFKMSFVIGHTVCVHSNSIRCYFLKKKSFHFYFFIVFLLQSFWKCSSRRQRRKRTFNVNRSSIFEAIVSSQSFIVFDLYLQTQWNGNSFFSNENAKMFLDCIDFFRWWDAKRINSII